jgi:hypothetical protein
MVVTIEGEFLEVERWPDKNTGEIRVATCLLSGSETVKVLGYDAGSEAKRLAAVKVRCDLRRTKDGYYFKALAP